MEEDSQLPERGLHRATSRATPTIDGTDDCP